MIKGKHALPYGWLQCPETGEPIQNLFYPFKTLLDEKYNDLVPVKLRFNSTKMNKLIKLHSLRLIIDLTNDNPFYNPQKLKNTTYKRLFIRALIGYPEIFWFSEFRKMIKDFRDSDPTSKIGVHCTDGYNLTGFMIVGYLIETEKMSLGEALTAFSNARPPGIFEGGYIFELKRIFNISENVNVPDYPIWAQEEMQCPIKKRGRKKINVPEEIDLNVMEEGETQCIIKKRGRKKNNLVKLIDASVTEGGETQCLIKKRGRKPKMKPKEETDSEEDGSQCPIKKKNQIWNKEGKDKEIKPDDIKEPKMKSTDISSKHLSSSEEDNQEGNVFTRNACKTLDTKMYCVFSSSDSASNSSENTKDNKQNVLLHEPKDRFQNIISNTHENPVIFPSQVPQISENTNINTEHVIKNVYPQVPLKTINQLELKAPLRNEGISIVTSKNTGVRTLDIINSKNEKPVIFPSQILQKSKCKDINTEHVIKNVYPQVSLMTINKPELKTPIRKEDIRIDKSRNTGDFNKPQHSDLNLYNCANKICRIEEKDEFTYNISAPSVVYPILVEKAMRKIPECYIKSNLIETIKDFSNIEYLRNKVRNILKTTKYGFVGIKYVQLSRKRLFSFKSESYFNTMISNGKRYLLFVAENNETYLIDEDNWFHKALNLKFPQLDNIKKSLKNTIFDGELTIERKLDKSQYVYLISNIYAFQGNIYKEINFSRRLIFIRKIVIEARNKQSQNLEKQPFDIRIKTFSKIDNLESIWNSTKRINDYQVIGLSFYPLINQFHNCLNNRIIYLWQPSEYKTITFKLKVLLESDGKTSAGQLFIHGNNVPYATIEDMPQSKLQEYNNKLVKCKLDIFSKKWTITEEETTRKTPISKWEIEDMVEDMLQPVTFGDIL